MAGTVCGGGGQDQVYVGGHNNFPGSAQNPQKFEEKGKKWHNMFFLLQKITAVKSVKILINRTDLCFAIKKENPN